MTPLLVDGYPALVSAFQTRKAAIGLTNLEVDDRGELPSGYFGKICCGKRTASIKSLGKVLEALEMTLVAVPKPALRGDPSQANFIVRIIELDADNRVIHSKLSGAKGHAARMASTSHRQRRAWARQAARERHRKARLKRLAEAAGNLPPVPPSSPPSSPYATRSATRSPTK